MNSEETPHFFKIIIENTTIHLNKLRIPRKFARKYGSELSGTVQVTVPDGEFSLAVEVAKSDNGEVWLEKGWREFSERYAFKPGYFLVFEYERNGSFQVLPFDLNCAAETEYPYISDSDHEECQPNKEEEEEAKVAIVSAELLNRTPQDNNFNGILNHCPPDGKTSKKRQRKNTSDKTAGSRSSIGSDIPSFTKTIRPSYLERDRMWIPSEFMKKTIFKAEAENVILQVAEKVWCVKLVMSKDDRRGSLGSGWVTFARENCLKVGDVCVFKLVNSTNDGLPPMLNVSISTTH